MKIALVPSHWRQLIRGTVEDSVDSGGLMCPTISGTGLSGLSWIKWP